MLKAFARMASNATGGYAHLFDAQAQGYSQFRIKYPEKMYQTIYDYCKLTDFSQATAFDIATGTGQAARQLAEKFPKVLASDFNVNQIKHASGNTNIEFKSAPAEETGVASNSVDLITVAQALHWFDIPKFFLEAYRVLKPGGSLAFWGYTVPAVDGNEEASKLLKDLRKGKDYLGPYWTERALLVENNYKDVLLDDSLFTNVTRTIVDNHMTCSIDSLMGFFYTWSSYNTFIKQYPERTDFLPKIREKLLLACNAKDGSEIISITWPMPLVMAQNKA